jgi:K+-sensing histidine kinase KdpD
MPLLHHFRLLDSKGKKLFMQADPGCAACLDSITTLSEKVSADKHCPKERRRGRLTHSTGTVEMCTSDSDLVASSSQFKKLLNQHAVLLQTISEIETILEDRKQKEIKQLTHNLTSINAHMLQEVYALISQDELGRGTQQQVQNLSKVIRDDVEEAAGAILKLLKNITAMKTDLAVFSKLRGAGFQLKFGHHAIHRIVTNAAVPFFQDFLEKNVRVTITDSRLVVWADYESISVALHHLFQNATKYIKHGSELVVRFWQSGDFVVTSFEMESLEISPNEMSSIFDDGQRGKAALKLGTPGDGLGMGVIKQLLDLNKGAFSLYCGTSTGSIFGVGYANNKFELKLQRSKKDS